MLDLIQELAAQYTLVNTRVRYYCGLFINVMRNYKARNWSSCTMNILGYMFGRVWLLVRPHFAGFLVNLCVSLVHSRLFLNHSDQQQLYPGFGKLKHVKIRARGLQQTLKNKNTVPNNNILTKRGSWLLWFVDYYCSHFWTFTAHKVSHCLDSGISCTVCRNAGTCTLAIGIVHEMCGFGRHDSGCCSILHTMHACATHIFSKLAPSSSHRTLLSLPFSGKRWPFCLDS